MPKAAGSSLTRVLAKWFSDSVPFDINQHPRLYKIDKWTGLGKHYQRLTKKALWLHYRNHISNESPGKIRLGNGYGLLLNERLPECLHGHFNKNIDGYHLFDIYPEASQFITFLRDPLDQFLSLISYNIDQSALGRYWNGRIVKLQKTDSAKLNEIVENGHFYLYNFLPWQLTKDNYQDILLTNFVHVGTVERFQESIDVLSNKLGFERVEVKKINSSSSSSSYRQLLSENAVSGFKNRNRLAYQVYSYVRDIEFNS